MQEEFNGGGREVASGGKKNQVNRKFYKKLNYREIRMLTQLAEQRTFEKMVNILF